MHFKYIFLYVEEYMVVKSDQKIEIWFTKNSKKKMSVWQSREIKETMNWRTVD